MSETENNFAGVTEVTIGEEQGEVDERIYGSFIEHIQNCIYGGVCDPGNANADESGIRQDVRELAAELAPSVVRFPGGTIMCQYHWEDAVGPQEDRIRRKNLIWGGELDPSFGTAEFVTWCRSIGAEPMICVNMASGSPEEAGNWVEYCNGTGHSHYAELRRKHGYEEPFNVKYWCIGNESYAEPDIGIHNDVKLYVRDAMEFIKFMKLTDKSIKTVIVGNGDDPDWNRAVLDALHPVTDYFSVHHYSGEHGRGLYEPFRGERHLKEVLLSVSALIDEYPEQVTSFNHWYRFPPRREKIAISLDEWNVWDFQNDPTYGLQERYNWRDALWTASVLNLMISTPYVKMACLAQLVNVIAPIVAEEKGAWLQTIAHPWLLYRNRMLGERLEASFEDPGIADPDGQDIPALSISAVRHDGKLYVAAVNRDLTADHVIRITLKQDDAAADAADDRTKSDGMGSALFESMERMVRQTVLSAPSPRSRNDLDDCCVEEEKFMTEQDTVVLKAGTVNLIKF